MKGLIWVLLCGVCLGQGSSPTGNPVALSPKGVPLANVQVAICAGQPSLTVPCGGSSLVQTYTTNTLGTTCAVNSGLASLNGIGCTNPGLTDQVGNVIAFAPSGGYWCQYYGPQVSGVIVQPCMAPAISGTTLNAVQYVTPAFSRGGADVGAEVQLAINGCASNSCEIIAVANPTCYTWNTPINFPAGKIVYFHGSGASNTCFNWTGATNVGGAITINSTISGGGYSGHLSDMTLCYQGCSPNVYTSNGSTGLVTGSTASTVSQVMVERVGFFGWNTAVGIGLSAFDITFLHDTFLNGLVGVGSSTNAVPIRIIASNFTAFQTAGILAAGAGSEWVLEGDDIEPSSVGGCGISITGNAIVTDLGSHYENPAGAAGVADTYVCITAANAHFSKFGGDFLEDRAVGTNPQFVLLSGGDHVDLIGISVNSAGATVTQVVNQAIAGATVNVQDMRNAQSATILATVGGTLGAENLNSCKSNGAGCQIFLRKTPLMLSDQGQCTAGTNCGPINLSVTYANAPTCFATWVTGNVGTGILSMGSTTTTVTVTSSAGAGDNGKIINWECFGN